jgi:RNA polymerase sigma factor (sigma-70 family)
MAAGGGRLAGMNRLPNDWSPRLTPGQEAELWGRFVSSGRTDLAARNRLIEQHLPLVKWAVKRYLHRRAHLERYREDLEGAATLKLIRAVECFEPTRGRFSTYAAAAIGFHLDRDVGELDASHLAQRRERIRHKEAARRAKPCEPAPLHATVPLQYDADLPEAEPAHSEDERLDLMDTLQRLQIALAELKDGDLLWRYYVEERVMRELAADYGLTKARIQQRIAAARKRARKLLAAPAKA